MRRRSWRRRPRRGRRTRAYRRGRRSWLSKVYTFRRTNVDTLTVNTTTPNPVYWFQLNEIPNYTEFTALYDQYRISKVVYKLIPRASQALPSNPNQGTLFSVIDYTDSNPLTSADQANEYASVKRTRGFKTHSRVIRPKLNVPLYETGAPLTFGYGVRSGWVNCADPAVHHYGLKFWYENPAAGAELVFDEYITYYVKFKNVK